MLRDKSLVPLSHQHQHALALCVRIEKAVLDPSTAGAFRTEMEQMWENELRFHFAAEESLLFPEAEKIESLRTLTQELIAEHGTIARFAKGAKEKQLPPEALREFAQVLSAHVRKEERQLFETLQLHMAPELMSELGTKIAEVLQHSSGQSCALKTQQTSKLEGEKT